MNMRKKSGPHLKADGWTVTDLPTRHREKDYDEAREEIVNKVKDINGVAAIVEFGTIANPGVSDIDIFVIFEDDASRMTAPKRAAFSEKTAYLMGHNLFVISRKNYRDIFYQDPWIYAHKTLFARGETGYVKPELAPDEQGLLSSAYIYQSLVHVLQTVFHYGRRNLPVHTLLEQLTDFIYCLREIDKLGHGIESDLPDRYRELKLTWFDIDPTDAIERLIGLFEEILRMCFRIAWKLANYVKPLIASEKSSSHGIGCISDPSGVKAIILSNYIHSHIYTEKQMSPEEAWEISSAAFKEYCFGVGRFKKRMVMPVVILPLTLSAYLLSELLVNGRMARFLRGCLCSVNGEKIPLLRQEVIQKRNHHISSVHGEWIQKRTKGDGASVFLDDHGYEHGRPLYARAYRAVGRAFMRQKMIGLAVNCLR